MKRILSEKDSTYITIHSKGQIVIDGINYYFKPCPDYLELVMSEVANLLELECPQYEIYNVKGKRFYLSKDLGHGGIFHTAEELGITNLYLPTIDKILSLKYQSHYPEIHSDLTKIFILDILFLNYDRNPTNFGIQSINGIDRLCILDNETSFQLPIVQVNMTGNQSSYNTTNLQAFLEKCDSLDWYYTKAIIELLNPLMNIFLEYL